MPCTLNKRAWEKLIDEDIDWLDKQPDTLEAKHISQNFRMGEISSSG